MKKLLPLLSVLFLIYWGCEEQQNEEVDTTPPTVSISSHSSGQTVFEIVNLVVNTQDNKEISKVEFFIDDSLVFIDLEEPYQYMWNTTPLIENSEHIVKVISYDNSDNFTISQPIMLIVKNESSFPESSQITSIIFEDGVFIITWNQCTDLDFESYQLEKSLEPEMNEFEVIFTSQNNIDTVFIDNNIDPLISQYYRTTVSDTLGLKTTSQIVLSSLDPVPVSVDITLVSYTIDEMTVKWEESTDSDFKEYKLLYSQTESGVKDTIIKFSDKSITSHTITEFNPNNENWYWVEVSDTLGQTSIGIGMTNSLNNQPTPVNVVSVVHNLESMTINWEEYVPNMSRINQINQNTRSTLTNDFVSYELLQSETEEGIYSSVVVITNQTTTSHSLIDYNPLQENWFKVKVNDYWGLNSTGDGMTNEIDSPPTQIDISSITYDFTEMVITWNESNDYDFSFYELLYSNIEGGELTSVNTINDINTTSYTITDFNPSEERWYYISITDYWSLTTMSNGYIVVDPPPTTPILYSITYNDGFEIMWSQNNNNDFQSYELYESPSEDMSNSVLIYETEVQTDTTFFKSVRNLMYYQIIVEDTWGLQSISNVEVGDYYIELWGEYYSVENTIELLLGQSQLTGRIPSEIGNLTNLVDLDLNSNQLIGPIPPELGNLTNLDYLSLYENQLTGSIPSEIGNLTNLNYLYLSDNQLTGFIPPEIGNLTNLNWLNLKNNQLTGSIPSEIGNLTNLNVLYLQSNQLSGIIPDEICNQGDSSPHLENNQLCPPYPSCVEGDIGIQDTSDCD